ncbi:hypothetical protein F5884DRAFT_832745 [Xylogone sp. PMI_703]|nr:hypothetical protein F5884DRAFT_832745 [Xylogone sp. PMI_703]
MNRYITSLHRVLPAPIQRLWNEQAYNLVSTHPSKIPKPLRHATQGRSWHPRHLLSLPHALVVIWVIALLWGERWVFQSAVEECEWSNWERWPQEATPHHLILIADPQLIDPHSYPDRPWPLQPLTFKHTDNYLKRSYIQLQKILFPDTIFFLGDLFDGGREWKTDHGNTDDPAWAEGHRPKKEQEYVKGWRKKYGESFWLKEYNRFGKIFFEHWNDGGVDPNEGQRGRKIIATLPGNHDLGFGDKIKIPIRERFETYFGEGNRVDVIGNHTFVSIDSVSLSAGSSDRPKEEVEKITGPVENFLSRVGSLKRKAVARELSYRKGKEMGFHYPHTVEFLKDVDFKHLTTLDPGPETADFPTILLTHVPLYRDPGTPCGPLREHWPPTPPPDGQTTPLERDDRNAISITRGYQYQNVLSEADSIRLVSTIGNVVQAYSGDDHDYCEIVHSPAKNSVREITVKSLSWAMGIRRPGFLMVSMWNPVGADGHPLHSMKTGHGSSDVTASPTLESHLCLLPDQVGILIRYGILAAISLIALITRAFLQPVLKLTPFVASPSSQNESDFPLLPTTNKDLKRRDDRDGEASSDEQRWTNSSTSSTSSNNLSSLAPRSSAARTRSVSPANGYGLPASQTRFATPPLINSAGYNPNWSNTRSFSPDKRRDTEGVSRTGRSRNGSIAYAHGNKSPQSSREVYLWTVWREASRSIWRVAWVVLGLFMYLARYG